MTTQRTVRIMPRVFVAGVGVPLGSAAELWLALEIGTAAFGRYAGMVALARVFAAMSSRGSESAIVRMRTMHPTVCASALLRWALIQTIPIAVVFFAAATLVTGWTGHQGWLTAAMLLAICPLCTAIMSIQGTLTALGQTGRAVIPISLAQPIGIAGGTTLIISGHLEPTVTSAALIGLGSWILALLAAITLNGRRREQGKTRRLLPEQRQACRRTLGHFTLLTIGNQVLARTDLALLGLLGTPTAAGVYAVVAKISGVMVIGMQAAASAIRPHLGSHYREGRLIALRAALFRVRGIGLIWASLVLIAGAVFLNLGHEYSDRFDPIGPIGWWTWAILCAAQFIIVATGPISAALNQTGHARRVAKSTLLVAVGTMVIQCVAAPMGMLWVAIVTMISRTSLRLLLVKVATRDVQLRDLFRLRVAS